MGPMADLVPVVERVSTIDELGVTVSSTPGRVCWVRSAEVSTPSSTRSS